MYTSWTKPELKADLSQMQTKREPNVNRTLIKMLIMDARSNDSQALPCLVQKEIVEDHSVMNIIFGEQLTSLS